MQYCRLIGAEPYICVNLGSGTLDEAQAWVEHCNGTGRTYWADLRRHHGHEEPYGVKYWGLGKPVVVGGDPEARGVVVTASYEARRFGIHSAMPCRTARRLCPQAVFLPPRFAVYRAVTRQLHELFLNLTALVEPIALDEAFLDVSTLVQISQEAEELARNLKHRIREETSLSASIGVASHKLVATVASDRHKPDGLTMVPPG